MTSLFTPQAGDQDDNLVTTAALRCIESFTERFNARDAAGMDANLHFPHVILSGEKLTVWERPGQLAPDFFDGLAVAGWHRTSYQSKRPVLVGPNKVHLLVEYSRDDADGRALSHHQPVDRHPGSGLGHQAALLLSADRNKRLPCQAF